MTKLRVLFNALGVLNTEHIFPKVKGLGIEGVSFFLELSSETLPSHIEKAAAYFADVNVNLVHIPSYRNETGWKEKLRGDCARNIPALAQLGVNNYALMIECNLYGYWWNPQVRSFVHRDRLIEHFNAFYEYAHEFNPGANVILVPYAHPLMNLNCGRRGWKDWWIKYGEEMKFDQVAVDAHVGVWIHAFTRRKVYSRLVDAIRFLERRGYTPLYVEVGYPTTGFKPLLGWYGWGREEDQVDILDACYRALSDLGVPWMQICEFIDPATPQIYDTPLLGNKGRVPRFLGVVPVIEELHWGLLRSDGSEKKVCEWVRETTGRSIN